MHRWSKRIAKGLLREVSERVVDSSKNVDRIAAIDQCTQIMLMLKYQELVRSGAGLPSLNDVEFRCFSQNGEDGILLYLFGLLGAPTRRSVEVGVSDGIECNTANLIVNHGWTGLLIDGDAEALERGRRFYARCKTTFSYPPDLVHAWVTPENIDAIITDRGFTGEVDLLSIDIDGVDYWIWRAIDCIRPRVVLVECNTLLGPERSVTVPYRPNFVSGVPGHCGATVAAFAKLGRQKGYRLIGSQRYGFNAFFLRNDLGVDHFPEVPVESCFAHPHARRCVEEGRRNLGDLEWVEV